MKRKGLAPNIFKNAEEIFFEDIGLVNCECGAELLGPKTVEKLKSGRYFVATTSMLPPAPSLIAGGKCYCKRCSTPRLPPAGRGHARDVSPWQENAIRAMEGE